MAFVAEKASLDSFYKLIMDKSSNRCKDVNNNICYGATQFAKLRELFKEFRLKHNNFDYCAPQYGYDQGQYVILNCWPTDGSKGNLRSSVTQNGEKLAMSIEENENSVFEGLVCTSDASQEMRCQGTGALSSYSLTVTDNSCTEIDGSQNESCDQKLNLFKPLLQSTPKIPKKVAPNPSSSQSGPGGGGSPTQNPSTIGWTNVAGAVSALGFAYLTYKEARAWQKETGEARSVGKDQHQKASGWRALGYAGLAAGSTAFALLS